MYVVTGGAGFIGSNLVRALIDRGHDDIIVVDDLEDGHKFVNIADLPIADDLDKDEFRERLTSGKGMKKVAFVSVLAGPSSCNRISPRGSSIWAKEFESVV